MSHDAHAPSRGNFITDRVDDDRAHGRWGSRVVTRFPPEPNGFPHIGHAKSICLNFGLAHQYGGVCHLRMDDTNPTTEDEKFVQAFKTDVKWLGFDWGDKFFHASDYFDQIYQSALQLIRQGDAYVCSLSEDEIRATRGSLTEPGTPSPFRTRSVDENLALLATMRKGEHDEGAHVLRGKIDMANPNMKMRDPLFMRIKHAHHYRTGTLWHIYPLYDFAHCISDAIEGITHSICTLEFENNRELYDWILAKLGWKEPPKQIEFARLQLGYTVMSKRKLAALVAEGKVTGWDDPRMSTISGMRRRGYTPEGIRAFCDMIGIAKTNSMVDMEKLEFCVRDDLNHRAPRVLCVLDPLPVTLRGLPQDEITLDASLWPHDVPKTGTRPLHLTNEILIERDDFTEAPAKGYKRLAPGTAVRLRHGVVVRCDEVKKDESGKVTGLVCQAFPESLGADSPDGVTVGGVIHWVSATRSVSCEVRLYDRLFAVEEPDAAGEFRSHLNPDSLTVRAGARIEPAAVTGGLGMHLQFERHGYFCTDTVDHTMAAPVFNRTVELKDAWAKRTQKVAALDVSLGDAPKAVSPKSKTRPPKKTAAELRAEAHARHPELATKHAAFLKLGLAEQDADTLTSDPAIANFFETALQSFRSAVPLAKWVTNEVLRVAKESSIAALPFGPADLAELVALVDGGKLSASQAKEVFAVLAHDGGSPVAIVKAKGFTAAAADPAALAPFVAQVLAANADKVAQYKGGKTGLLGFFVGQVVKESGGTANPALAKQLVEEALA